MTLEEALRRAYDERRPNRDFLAAAIGRVKERRKRRLAESRRQATAPAGEDKP